MSAMMPEGTTSTGPWQRYITRERAARNGYLAVVENAHQQYLAGAWPDRDAYEVVERQAWSTYYAAGREAWRTYRDEIENPPPPPEAAPTAQADYPQALHGHGDGLGWPPHPHFTPISGDTR